MPPHHDTFEASAVAVRLPDLGADEDAVVTAWFADVGESVSAGERLVEVLIPGVVVDVSAPVAGRLAKVVAMVGGRAATDRLRVGDVLGWIEP